MAHACQVTSTMAAREVNHVSNFLARCWTVGPNRAFMRANERAPNDAGNRYDRRASQCLLDGRKLGVDKPWLAAHDQAVHRRPLARGPGLQRFWSLVQAGSVALTHLPDKSGKLPIIFPLARSALFRPSGWRASILIVSRATAKGPWSGTGDQHPLEPTP